MLVLANTGLSFAYQTFNNHRLVYGVSGQNYWLDATAADNNYCSHGR
jgi:hypothetical protein